MQQAGIQTVESFSPLASVVEAKLGSKSFYLEMSYAAILAIEPIIGFDISAEPKRFIELVDSGDPNVVKIVWKVALTMINHTYDEIVPKDVREYQNSLTMDEFAKYIKPCHWAGLLSSILMTILHGTNPNDPEPAPANPQAPEALSPSETSGDAQESV